MRLLALLLAVAVCVLTGCGASKSHGAPAKAGYERQMAAIVPPLQSKILKLRLALEEVRSPILARQQLRNIETRLADGIARLQALSPPAEVAADHAKLIAGYRLLRKEFVTALTPALSRSNTDAFRVEAGRLEQASGFRAIANALEAIIGKGYDLGFPQGS